MFTRAEVGGLLGPDTSRSFLVGEAPSPLSCYAMREALPACLTEEEPAGQSGDAQSRVREAALRG